MNCPFCGKKMELIKSEVTPNLEELKLVDGKPSKMTVTLKTLTWRCDCLSKKKEKAKT